MIDEYLIDDLNEYFAIQSGADAKAAGILLLFYGPMTKDLESQVRTYLNNRSDADCDGCNEEMSLLGRMERHRLVPDTSEWDYFQSRQGP
jgi:hypothetical protein